jgi:DNA-directed RNA polymerase subunit RPC12/RpoP
MDLIFDSISKDRPVRCAYCSMKMFYAGHKKHEPEHLITVDNKFSAYIHKRCWENLWLANNSNEPSTSSPNTTAARKRK